MKSPNTRMDMDGWSSSRFGYGWIWICLPLWIGLDWMDIPIFEYVHVFQSTTTKRKVLNMPAESKSRLRIDSGEFLVLYIDLGPDFGSIRARKLH